MDVVISGRHCTVSDSVKEEVNEKLKQIEKLRDRITRVEVEFTVNNSVSKPEEQVECQITLRSKGPVVRAESFAADKMAAFDRSLDRLTARLRKAADRRKQKKGLRSLAAVAPMMVEDLPEDGANSEEPQTHQVAGMEVTGDGPLIVREKTFETVPLTLAQALDEMELVGHDFFLYLDKETKQPSVVYRRRAYDYGVLHLDVAE